jgi:hypothetical protein
MAEAAARDEGDLGGRRRGRTGVAAHGGSVRGGVAVAPSARE